ncbi:prenyltransferase [Halomicrobium mukohataei]|uniref:Prenyltransferase n=1 Tax=Halomicrobium mukohataei TaxID=57705 RepID=A0A847UE61_9EURY|nr:prenyltransferase [Halomicrobium mukohataei]NLV09694.1 prenyltransferase [Halomicrobium mukohataei]
MSAALSDRLATLLPSEESRLGYLLWLSRPRFWLYLAGPVIIGVTYAADSSAQLFAPVAVALFAYFLVPANVFLYGVNDAFDADVDEYNPKKDDEEGKEVRFQRDPVVLAAIALSGLAALAFVPFLPTVALVVFAAWAVLSVEYSAPPARFKTTPLLDSLSNGLYILPAVIAYTTIEGALPPTLAVVGAWLWSMGMHTFSAIPDIEPDREAGIRTTATWLGQRRTYYYCGACWVAAAATFGLVHPVFGVLLGLYPVLIFGITLAGVDVHRAYWWYPAINTLVGMSFTLVGLWVMLHG